MKTIEALKQQLCSGVPSMRREAIRRIAEEAKAIDNRYQIISLLKGSIEQETDPETIGEAVSALLDLGVTLDEISTLLSQNAAFFRLFESGDTRYLYNTAGSLGEAVRRAAALRYGVAPHTFALGDLLVGTTLQPLLHDADLCRHIKTGFLVFLRKRFPTREVAELQHEAELLWHELVGHIQYETTAPALSDILSLLSSLVSLRMTANVGFQELHILRFRALREHAVDEDGRDLPSDWLGERDLPEEVERAFDEVRSSISQLEADLKEKKSPINEASKREEIENLRKKEDELRKQLEEETREIYPDLDKQGVGIKPVAVEGILGEYFPGQRQIVLYPPMLRLSAKHLARSLQRPLEEVYEDLRLIVLIHEAAHAVHHLGADADGRIGSYAMFEEERSSECFAQWYTIRLIRKLQAPENVEKVFLELNKEQRLPYRLWQLFADWSNESVRDLVLQWREKYRK